MSHFPIDHDPLAVHRREPAGGTSMTAMMVVPESGRSPVPFVVMGLVLVTAAYVGVLAVEPGGHALTVQISDVLTTLAAAAAALSCALTGRRHHGAMRAFWWLLAAACASWATGEAMWSWYEVVLGEEVPYPSVADVGYLIGTPLSVAAFACHPAARSRAVHRQLVPLLDGMSVATSMLFVSWTLVLSPLWQRSGGMSLGDLIAVAYPFGDVIILVLVVLALRNLPAGNRPATALMLTGLLAMALTDSAYTYLAQIDAYQSGDVIDAGWLAAYLAIAAAARIYESPRDGTRTVAGSPPLVAVVAPYVPIVVALGVVAVRLPLGGKLDDVEWMMALCLTVLVISRQVIEVSASRRDPSARAEQSRAATAAATASNPRGAHHRPETRSEMHELTLEILAAARPTAQERGRRVSSSLVLALTSVAAVLALWDLSLLVRGAAGAA